MQVTPRYSSASLGGSSSLDFEQPPKGLQLPKEVDLLVSLVQSLRKVVLDLHLDMSADVHASADHASPEGYHNGRAPGARSFPDRLPASRVRSESQLGQAAGGSEKSTLELLRGDNGTTGGGGGRMNRSARCELIFPPSPPCPLPERGPPDVADLLACSRSHVCSAAPSRSTSACSLIRSGRVHPLTAWPRGG